MPKIKPLARPDPWRSEITAEIWGGMKSMGLTIQDLSKMSGIKRTTLQSRIGKNGDIGSMRLDELESIRKVLRRGA